MRRVIYTSVLFCLAAVALAQWKPEPVQFVAGLGKGKTVKTYFAPNKASKLMFHDEDEVGDFVWRRVYVKHKGRLALVDAYQEVSNVKWINKGRTVQFKAVKATDSDEFTTFIVEYTLGSKTYRSKAVKVEKFDMGE